VLMGVAVVFTWITTMVLVPRVATVVVVVLVVPGFVPAGLVIGVLVPRPSPGGVFCKVLPTSKVLGTAGVCGVAGTLLVWPVVPVTLGNVWVGVEGLLPEGAEVGTRVMLRVRRK